MAESGACDRSGLGCCGPDLIQDSGERPAGRAYGRHAECQAAAGGLDATNELAQFGIGLKRGMEARSIRGTQLPEYITDRRVLQVFADHSSLPSSSSRSRNKPRR